NSCQLWNEIVGQNARIGIHVVNCAAIDSDRSQQTGILAHAGKIGATVALIEKNGSTSVSTFDLAVEVVPLVDPAERRVGLLQVVETGNVLAAGNSIEESEDTVENSAVGFRGDHQRWFSTNAQRSKPETIAFHLR